MNAISCFRGHGGPGTCITYDAVNHAYIEARKRIRKSYNQHINLLITKILN